MAGAGGRGGDGLPICCISGLGVAEAARGAGAGPPKGSGGLSTFLGNNYWGFYKAALRSSETVMGNRGADSENLHSCPEISQKSLQTSTPRSKFGSVKFPGFRSKR